jgi:hypothetical protein
LHLNGSKRQSFFITCQKAAAVSLLSNAAAVVLVEAQEVVA